MSQHCQKPLVSVCVITYNSSKYILEALDSIKAQTYPNIELIISDDCSKDDTVIICKKWIDENKNRFVNLQLITVEHNTGISPNANRGARVSNGEWLKFLAGDDKLLPNCIEDNINFVLHNVGANFVFSKARAFGKISQGNISSFEKSQTNKFKNVTSKELHILLCNGNLINASTSFISNKYFRALGGFEESIPFIEDWPFWVKVSQHNLLYFMDRFTTEYRFNENSISQSNSAKSKCYLENLRLCKVYNLKFMRKISWFYWLLGYSRYLKEYSNGLLASLLIRTWRVNPFYYLLQRITEKYFS